MFPLPKCSYHIVPPYHNERPPILKAGYAPDKIYQELIEEDNYFDVRSDERLYFDLRASSEYVKEADKLERNDSHQKPSHYAEKCSNKKIKAKGLGSFNGRISVCFK